MSEHSSSSCHFFLDAGSQAVAKESYLEMKQELLEIKNENLKLKFQVRKQELPDVNLLGASLPPSDQLKPCAKVIKYLTLCNTYFLLLLISKLYHRTQTFY